MKSATPRVGGVAAGGAPDATRAAANPGLEQAIENASRDWWYQGALVAVRQLASTERVFTVDPLADLVGDPPDPHYWGALLAAAQKLKIVEPLGARIGRGGRPVRVWWGLPSS